MTGLDKDELVRLRAYSLWIEEGQPEGREREHWQKARREVEFHVSARDRDLDGHLSPQQAAGETAKTPSRKPARPRGTGRPS